MLRAEAIEKAKNRVLRRCVDAGKRAWLRGAPPDSYKSAEHRVNVWVIEGSPPRGYVLETPLFVKAISGSGDGLCTYYVTE